MLGKQRKTHQWDLIETLVAMCPYCRRQIDPQYGVFVETDIIHCPHCKKEFELGERK